MRNYFIIILLFGLLLSSLLAAQNLFALQVEGEVDLSKPLFEAEENIVELLGRWKFHNGDDPEWANPDYNDSSWQLLNIRLDGDDPNINEWNGIGWFRLHLNVDFDLTHIQLAGICMMTGAIEMYVNGEQVYNLGIVSPVKKEEKSYRLEFSEPFPVMFDREGVNVIAVRFSNLSTKPFFKVMIPAGFSMILSTPETIYRYHEENTTASHIRIILLIGATIAIFILHFLMFIFSRKFRGDLFFAIFVMFIALGAYAIVIVRQPGVINIVYWREVFYQIALLGVGISGINFVYFAFLGWRPIQFKIFFTVASIAAVSAFFTHLWYTYIFFLICLFEILRVIIMAAQKRVGGAWIIATGATIWVLTVIQTVLAEMHIMPVIFKQGLDTWVYGVAALIISMSVYLSYDFAKTNRNLEEQIVQVKELSDQALESEREAKAQEIKTLRLESENRQKALKLEEAEKREKVLRDLEIAHKELKDAQTQLVQSEKMASLGNLVAGVAHEINNPIGAVVGMHDTLMRAIENLKNMVTTELSAEKQEELRVPVNLKVIEDANRVITEGTQRVQNIVKQLKSFARLDEAEMQSANINKCLKETFDLCRYEMGDKIKLVEKFGELPDIVCYPAKLNQLFLNVLMNAIQAIEGEGTVTVSTEATGGNITVTVQDSGVGIEDDAIKEIFDPGYTTKGVGVGTGLGLSIAYQIIEEHKGEIVAESEVGVGTKITIRVPVSEADTG